MRTGTRCTILMKLPVAFSGGNNANCAPVPGAKLSTDAGDGLIAQRVDLHCRLLAHPHAAHLGLLVVGDQVDVLYRHHRHQPGARLHELTHLGGLVADAAVDAGANDGVVQIQLRGVGGGLGAFQLGARPG